MTLFLIVGNDVYCLKIPESFPIHFYTIIYKSNNLFKDIRASFYANVFLTSSFIEIYEYQEYKISVPYTQKIMDRLIDKIS